MNAHLSSLKHPKNEVMIRQIAGAWPADCNHKPGDKAALTVYGFKIRLQS